MHGFLWPSAVRCERTPGTFSLKCVHHFLQGLIRESPAAGEMIPPHWFVLFCGSAGGRCSRESYLLSFDGRDSWIVFVWRGRWACFTGSVMGSTALLSFTRALPRTTLSGGEVLVHLRWLSECWLITPDLMSAVQVDGAGRFTKCYLRW